MTKWIEVITDPLGLAGFALFLIFLFLTKYASQTQKKQLIPVFIIAAFISLIGGVVLVWESSGGDVTHKEDSPIIKNIIGDVYYKSSGNE